MSAVDLVRDWVELPVQLSHGDRLWVDRLVYDLLVIIMALFVEHC